MLARLRVPEIDLHLRARQLPNRAARPGNDLGAGALIFTDQRLQLFRVKSVRERACSGEVADEDRQLPSLEGAWCSCRFSRDLIDGFGRNRRTAARSFALPSVPFSQNVAVQCLGLR